MTERAPAWVWVPAEVLLAVTTIASILTLERIFTDTSFVGSVVFSTVVAHGLLIAMRRLGFGVAIGGAVSFVGMAAAVIAAHYPDTALAVVIATPDTIDALQLDLRSAQVTFETVQAPVPPERGFVVIASLGYWLAAMIGDWAAFRLRSVGQALLPVGAALILVSLLGVEERRIETTAVLVIAAMLFALAAKAAIRSSDGVWLGDGATAAYSSLMTTGAAVAAIAVLAGVLGGPALPGANDAPLIELGDTPREQSAPLEVVSPMVEIKPRLVNQSDQVMFTVETNQRAYWRTTALDIFDGSLWRSNGKFSTAREDLTDGYDSRVPVAVATQSFEITGFNSVWAPTAYVPVRLQNLSDIGLNFDDESGTFIVDVDDQSVSDGLRYQVDSQIASFTPALLNELALTSDDTVDASYLSLPDNFSPTTRAVASEITAGLTTPYEKALALQNFFRSNFVYDLDVAKGHNIERIEDFLEVRRGYCEQFAGTFAAMARSVGLPARVAQGFTPGDPDPLNPNRYIVRGRHAHAWPEVFISGAGWVAFEPTPGRGAPNASEYTGVPESQDSTPAAPEALDAESETAAEPPPQPDSSEVAPPEAAQPTPTPVVPDQSETAPTEAGADIVDTPSSSNILRLLLAIVLVLAALAAWIFGVPALKRRRAARRSEAVHDDTRTRVALAWSLVVDRLEGEGLAPRGAETLTEYASRIDLVHAQADHFQDLTALAVEAAYGSHNPTTASAERAEELASQILAHRDATLTWSERSWRDINPASLLSRSDPVSERARRLANGAIGELVTTS